MCFRQLCRDRAAEGVAEIRDASPLDPESGTQMIVRGASVKLGTGVGWCTAKSHVAAIFRQKDRKPRMPLDGTGPIHLPHCKLGIPVKAEQNAGRTAWIPNHEPKQRLAIHGVVCNSPAERWLSQQRRRLKENSLLLLPKESECAKDQDNNQEYGCHLPAPRGFQRVCMAGNLR